MLAWLLCLRNCSIIYQYTDLNNLIINLLSNLNSFLEYHDNTTKIECFELLSFGQLDNWTIGQLILIKIFCCFDKQRLFDGSLEKATIFNLLGLLKVRDQPTLPICTLVIVLTKINNLLLNH